MSSQNLAWCNL